MEVRIVKIEGEFLIVELPDGEKKVCPTVIFPVHVNVGDFFCIKKIEKRNI